jgi:hypothetical protein
MASPSRSARGFGADASGAVWEVGLVTMPAFVAQAHGSTVRPLIALALEPAIANALHDPQAPLPARLAAAHGARRLLVRRRGARHRFHQRPV